MKSLSTLCMVALFLASGCDSAPPTVDPEKPHGEWTALQDLQTEGLMIIGQDASMGNWRAVRAGAASEPFQKAVEKFTSASLPPELEEHQDLKAKFDEGLNSIVATAKSGGNPQEMEANYNKAMDAMKELKAKLDGDN